MRRLLVIVIISAVFAILFPFVLPPLLSWLYPIPPAPVSRIPIRYTRVNPIKVKDVRANRISVKYVKDSKNIRIAYRDLSPIAIKRVNSRNATPNPILGGMAIRNVNLTNGHR